MEIKRVCMLYFSATGNTDKTVGIIGGNAGGSMGRPAGEIFLYPSGRTRKGICLSGHRLGDGGCADLCGKAPE